MARKKGSRRRKSRLVTIPFDGQLAMGAAADQAVVKQDMVTTLGEDLFVISVDVACDINGKTAGEGPINIGMAHDDLSVAEIAEALEADLTDPDDIIAKERARRPVRAFGKFSGGQIVAEVWNEGREQRVPIRWSVGDGHTLSFYGRNNTGAQMNTGALINFTGRIYGRWQR